jgi:hypothetical protein
MDMIPGGLTPAGRHGVGGASGQVLMGNGEPNDLVVELDVNLILDGP